MRPAAAPPGFLRYFSEAKGRELKILQAGIGPIGGERVPHDQKAVCGKFRVEWTYRYDNCAPISLPTRTGADDRHELTFASWRTDPRLMGAARGR